MTNVSNQFGNLPQRTRKIASFPTTYEEARKVFGDTPIHSNVRLGTNVHLHIIKSKNGPCYGIKFYDTFIVMFHSNGTYELNTGGFRTISTRKMMDNFVPFRIETYKHDWYLFPNDLQAVKQPITGEYVRYASPSIKADRELMTKFGRDETTILVDAAGNT